MDPNQQDNNSAYPMGGSQGMRGNKIDLDNYIPDPSKSNDLRRRLYDSGISNIPMPSVKRPIEENISSKPFSAKMNSSKIQSLSQIKKKIQDLNTNIIQNLNQSYHEAAIKEAEYLGEGTADYYRSQHIIIQQPAYVKPSNVGQKLQSSMAVSMGQPRMTGQLLNRKAAMVEPLDPAYTTKAQEKLQQQSGDPNRVMAGPPSLVYAGFEGGESMSQKNLEQARSKFLLDKLTGKLPPRTLPPIDGRSSGNQSQTDLLRKQEKDKQNEVKPEIIYDLTSEDTKKPKKMGNFRNLDQFIEILLESKQEGETCFVYLKPQNKSDPYDLKVVDYTDRQPETKYYTLSGKGLTLYENDTPVEFLGLGQWLMERDSYNHIKDFSFFKQFKSWKFMRMWKKTIKMQNRNKAVNDLDDNLFMLQNHFREHLSKHRKLMLEMSHQRFVDTCLTTDPRNIEEFSSAQLQKRIQVTKAIESTSVKARQNIQDCMDNVLSELRVKITGELTIEETRKQDNPDPKNSAVAAKKKDTKQVYEDLGFPSSGMTYAHRSSLRKECSRFLRFAYLADFLSLESLANIYIGSLEDMINRLSYLDGCADMQTIMNMQFDDQNSVGQAPRGREPLFYTQVQLNDQNTVPASDIVEVKIDDFLPHPRGKSQTEDYDLLAHVEVKEPSPEDEDDNNDDEEEEEDLFVQKYKKTVPNIQEHWIQLEPTKNNFSTAVIKSFSDGLSAIKCFIRRSKHKDLEKYSNVLEKWDDRVGDDWEAPELQSLDPQSWIMYHPINVTREKSVTELVENSYGKADEFLTRFQPLLEIYWRNKQFDKNVLIDENLINAVETLTNVLQLLRHYAAHFASNLPGTTDIGLLHLDSKKIRSMLLPTPKDLQESIEKLVPERTKIRTLEVSEWLSQSIRELQKSVNDVSDFVEQSKNYNRINELFNPMREKIDLYGQFLNVISNVGSIKIKKEDENAIKDAEKEISRLAQIIAQVESSQESQSERFKKDLAEKLIPQLNREVHNLTQESVLPQYLDLNSDKPEMIKQLDEKMDTFKRLDGLGLKYNDWEEELKTPLTQFNNIEELREELTNRHLLWHSVDEFENLDASYKKKLFVDINVDEISAKADHYQKIANRLNKSLPSNEVQVKLAQMVETFKGAMPIVKALRRPELKENHWAAINDLLENGTLNVDEEGFTLQSLIDLDVVRFQDEICQISIRATGEAKLIAALEELEAKWKEQIIVTKKYKEKDGCFVVDEVDVLYEFLDESMAQINMIRGNQYKAVIEDKAEALRRDLNTLSNAIEELIALQKNWMYLENIFQSPEIRRDLPDIVPDFDAVNKAFLTIMQKIEKSKTPPKVIKVQQNLVDYLKAQNATLESCQKRLDEFLGAKRQDFPRFFFLSDDEVLHILANASNINVIQGYLKALFDGLIKLQINEDTGDAQGMLSKEAEFMPFLKPIKPEKQIEMWLNKVQDSMREAVAKALKIGLKKYTDPKNVRKEWVTTNPGQVVATASMINWCNQTQDTIEMMSDDPDALNQWYNTNETLLKELTMLVRGKLTDLQRAVLVALITQDVHARDIVEDLRKDNVSNQYDFNWQKQLRYYYEEEQAAEGNQNPFVTRQIQATLYYGYEYMGATSRLVITPLTDRCWITITGALHIKLGANPAGPAGTGKTESTKDLAKGVACLCIVYNCSDQVNYLMMERHFSGLAQQGCWTCLDEFNRIDIEVLSVIAQQLQDIRKGLLVGEDEMFFQGKTMRLKQDFGCHITMNPGYAGRTELPDNLKVLFRPVAMMIPNYGLIAEVMLFSEGFVESRILSKKMVQLYKLSSEQLSKQDHYDFGMRAVKSVLVMAGDLKRANPDDSEDAVLIRAMKDANVPKFLKDDLPLFAAIVQDLFPTVQIKDPNYDYLNKEIAKALKKRSLQAHAPFMAKVIQLFETFNVRFGVMLVGATNSGKTRCYEILADVMTNIRKTQPTASRLFQEVVTEILNPKAISMGELYGEVDFNTQEWTDGLASKMMRNAANLTGEERNWTVFDGPVDALWIENMNTVLDDNMTLCLANGQRIKLRSQMRMLFEVENLAVASPATVSRCGMVFLTPEDLGWRPFVRTWLDTTFENDMQITTELKEHIWETFLATVDVGLEKLRQSNMVEPIKTDDLQQVRSMCNFLEILLLDPKTVIKGDEKQQKKDLESLIAFSYTFGMGSSLTSAGQNSFDTIVRERFNVAQYPSGYSVFDYWYDIRGKERTWRPWSDMLTNRKFEFVKEKPFFDLMVETETTIKHAYCLEMLLNGGKPLFFTGESGVGKSVIIQNVLSRMGEKETQPIYLNFSAQTDSKRTQQSIQEKLEKVSRKKLGAPIGKKNAIFVDDINMPTKEFYGAQPPIELLRFFLDKKGLYERADWEWKDVENTTIIAAAAPPVGGRSPLTMRFSQHFNMFCVPEASDGILENIFGTILDGFLKAYNFAEGVMNLSAAAVKSTVDIYNKIAKELRPTPAKFHYMFNLRDMSKVVQGVLMTRQMSINSPESFAKLWVNEVSRVFMDRLINEHDSGLFVDWVMDALQIHFKISLEKDEIFKENKIMFGDLLKLDAPVQLYEEIKDTKKLNRALYGFLEEYNIGSANKMNLVFFDDAVHHILRIARALRQPRGNIMLIGVGGSGKQSLVRLASHMYEIKFMQVEIKKDYKSKDFNEFIKEIMFLTGIDGVKVAFTLTDSQILFESMLEDINNVLNTGEIPNLMLPEDKDRIQNEVREKTKLQGSADQIQAAFVNRVRENFHNCLCMSPVGNDLRVRCRQFPSLVNCCTLDWFDRWPEEALLYVSRAFLKDVQLPSEDVREGLARMCMLIHTSVEDSSNRFYDELRRRVYTTPKSYLDLISLYLNTLATKRQEINANKDRLDNGLRKLEETNVQIADLKVSLAKAAPMLKEKEIVLADTLQKVSVDKTEADAKEAVVLKEKEVVEVALQEATVIKEDVESDLAAAQPELDRAKQAVAALKKEQVVEMANFPKPPDAVVLVMEPIMMLLGNKTDWDTTKKAMKDTTKFLESLKNFDVSTVKESKLKKIRNEYLSKPEFTYDYVKSKSSAAAGLCMWIQALSKFQIVHKKIVPKQEKLKEASSAAAEAKATLDTKLAEVDKVKKKVAELEATAKSLNDEKVDLETTINRDENRMRRAEQLVVLLADEGVRWKDTVKVLAAQIERLVGDVFLSCACISYFGGFSGVYRNELTDMWTKECIERGIPTGDEFSLIKVMGDPVQISEWNINSLPSDRVSLENGILTTQAERYGLCIDPQGQANKWIKNMLRAHELTSIKFTTDNWLRAVVMCVYNGKPLLIEDLKEHIDPALDPILLHQEFMGEDGTKQIKLDREEPYPFGDGFKLYMTTKEPNPHYPPEVCIKVTLINFTVTSQGLEEQMLGDVVIKERPEVEAKRQEIVISMDRDAKTLKGIENNILRLLQENEVEEILDADTLIDVLKDSKVTSKEINERIAEAEVVEKEIIETRNLYTSIAVRGSIIYFVIADMANINFMYQNSLQFIKVLFNKAIDATPKSDDLDKRLADLIDVITKSIFANVSRGLFEADKLIFTYLLATSIKRNEGIITPMGWNMLLRGTQPISNEQRVKKPENPFPKILTDLKFEMMYSAECNIKAMESIIEDMETNNEAWTNWATCMYPEDEALPGEWETNLTDFQKSVLLKIFRPEKLMFAFKQYVKKHMGNFYTDARSTTMEGIYKDTDNITPLIFILSTGADPTDALLKFAKERGFLEKLESISLGQGQSKKAQDLIKRKCEDGGWVLLQNCHLSREFAGILEKIVIEFENEKDEIHPEFRLFLTSMPVDFFPVSVLQNGVKLTTEPPRGIKANLKRSFQEVTDDWLNDCKKDDSYRKLVFAGAFFHAVVQERRKFGPLGWNIAYEFNDSDLQTSFTMLKIFLDDQEEIPWDALVFVTGHINYGGRVTDDQDRRCLLTTLEKYFCIDNLNDEYVYSESEKYRAPTYGTAQSYRDYIDQLPEEEQPEVFGLHENANIAYQRAESDQMVTKVLSIQPRVATVAGGLTPDQIVKQKIEDIKVRVPENLERSTGLKDLFKKNSMGLLPSLTTVLLQEIEKFNRLLNRIRKSLTDLDMAIDGFILMSAELDAMFMSLQNGTVPKLWEDVAYPSLKPLASWYEDLILRVEFMAQWLAEGNPNAYWISGFFFPQGFMTGCLQTHARQYKIAIDELNFAFEILKAEEPDEIDEKPQDGVLIYGLFMDGARYNRDQQCIDEQHHAVLYDQMPMIHFRPQQNYIPNPEEYSCPVYKTGKRAGVLSTTGQSTNFVLMVEVPVSQEVYAPPSHWIRRAAALLCQLND